jgi:hypothetical protein
VHPFYPLRWTFPPWLSSSLCPSYADFCPTSHRQPQLPHGPRRLQPWCRVNVCYLFFICYQFSSPHVIVFQCWILESKASFLACFCMLSSLEVYLGRPVTDGSSAQWVVCAISGQLAMFGVYRYSKQRSLL